MKIRPRERQEIVKLHQDDGYSLQMIADQFGITRQGIKKILNNLGIDTSKRAVGKRSVVCTICDTEFEITRARWRRTRYPFCSSECYHCWLEVHAINTNEWRQGQRLARMRVARLMGLESSDELPVGSVVHHEDGDHYNYQPWNLILFANQGDHIRWHRGHKDLVKPLWGPGA